MTINKQMEFLIDNLITTEKEIELVICIAGRSQYD